MRYWMTFDNNIKLSDTAFLGRSLNIQELKDRFNAGFIKGTANYVEISFLIGKQMTSFIAGFRQKRVVIINKATKQEYNPKEFSCELNKIEAFLNPKNQLTN